MDLQDACVEVVIPDKYAVWFRKHRTWPVRVRTSRNSAVVEGGQPYRIHAVNKEHLVAYRALADEFIAVGEITKHGLLRPLSDAARHDLGAIRAALFRTNYPAPIAYEMGNRELVHPGACFNKHRSTLIRRTLFTVSNEEARCAVCAEAFE